VMIGIIPLPVRIWSDAPGKSPVMGGGLVAQRVRCTWFGDGVPDLRTVAESRITLFGRPGCHLCEYAREALERVRARTGVGWIERSVADDPEWEAEYGARVPVILLDGREHSWFRVEEERLLADLAPDRKDLMEMDGIAKGESDSGTVVG
jgi:glutaredoxin